MTHSLSEFNTLEKSHHVAQYLPRYLYMINESQHRLMYYIKYSSNIYCTLHYYLWHIIQCYMLERDKNIIHKNIAHMIFSVK